MSHDPKTRIQAAKKRYGSRLAILAHHYQGDAVARHADHLGDSLELARKIADLTADYVVFCGVFFMAETAAILAKPGQKVLIPDFGAKCVMSEMAPAPLVAAVLSRLGQAGLAPLGLTYVNSSAAVKALCGQTGGSVCTSANAERMLSWALGQRRPVLFLPDRMLAANACDALGLPEDRRLVLNVRQGGALVDTQAAKQADILIWPGRCVIHSRFKTQTIAAIRRADPAARIVVHPECSPETVKAADAAGSTSFLIRYVAEAPGGATIHIGTETNLVARLAATHAGEKTILPLRTSLCSNMARITEAGLAELLDNLEAAPAADVPEDVAVPSRQALRRMLTACA